MSVIQGKRSFPEVLRLLPGPSRLCPIGRCRITPDPAETVGRAMTDIVEGIHERYCCLGPCIEWVVLGDPMAQSVVVPVAVSAVVHATLARLGERR